MTHAGFWVDGAVRKPEQRHADKAGWVVYKEKQDTIGHIQCSWNEVDDSMVWLDTTPRESLTPEELLSVAKVLSPSATRVEKRNDGPLTFWIVDDEESSVKVDWGNLTQYPPPAEPQWVRITRENVARYLFSSCRYGDTEPTQWNGGCVVGWDVEDGCCLVDCDIDSPDRVMKFIFVEVQNAPTS